MISQAFLKHLYENTRPRKGEAGYQEFHDLWIAKAYMSNPGEFRTLCNHPTWLKQPEWDYYILCAYYHFKQENPKDYQIPFRENMHHVW